MIKNLTKKLFRKQKSFLLILFLMLTCFGYSQRKKLSGTVSDVRGQPLPGVNVIEKNGSNGVVTDFDGNYTISVSTNATLSFSFVGFKTKEVSVAGKTSLNVVLDEDVTSLNEVVVLGYGSVQKKELTSSITSISEKDFNQGLNVTSEQLIQGKTPGLNINTARAPGSGSRIQIRGITSISGDTEPLYIIDGVPIGSGGNNVSSDRGAVVSTNPMSFINPNDVKSVSILKGPSAIAVYGSRGANGVVLITTKSGKAGEKPQISFGVVTTVGEAINLRKSLSAERFLEVAQQFGTTAFDYGFDTNWNDEVTQTSVSTQYNFSASGGSDKSTYYGSLSWLDEEGVVINSGQKRLTGRVNFSTKGMDDRLEIDFNTTFSGGSLDIVPTQIAGGGGNGGPIFAQTASFNPTAPVYNPDGSFFEISLPNDFFRNPVALAKQGFNNQKSNNFLSSFSAKYALFKDVLKIGGNFSYAQNDFMRNILYPSNSQYGLDASNDPGGLAFRRDGNSNNYLGEFIINFNKDFGNHSLKVDAGYSYQDIRNSSHFSSQAGILTDAIGTNIIGTGDPLTILTGTNESSTNVLRSYFGRATYGYLDRYFVTAVIRQDGSSRFAKGEPWGTFPSLAMGWRISEEDFMKNSNVFDDLKLRAEWGTVGNNAIPENQTQTFLNINSDGSVTVGGVGNPNLTWETTETYNVGLDFGLFNSRITGSIDWYKKTTKDLFLNVLVPGITVDNTLLINAGNVENTGIEFALNAGIVQAKSDGDFNFDLGFNMAYNKNEVTSLSGSNTNTEFISYGSFFGPSFVGDTGFRIEPGQAIHSFYGPVYAGLAADGQEQYFTEDGSVTLLESEAEEKFLGNAIPKITYAFTPNFNYKRFSLSAVLRGAMDFQVADNTAMTFAQPARFSAGYNMIDYGLDEPNLSANTVNEFSSQFVFDADFLKIDNVTIGYNLDVSKLSMITNARLFITGTNLAIFTKYHGSDPEAYSDARSENNVSAVYGVDYISYPTARTFSLGINLTF